MATFYGVDVVVLMVIALPTYIGCLVAFLLIHFERVAISLWKKDGGEECDRCPCTTQAASTQTQERTESTAVVRPTRAKRTARSSAAPTQVGKSGVCAICLGDMEGQLCSLLQCKHAFHACCLQQWWHFSRHTRICPLCRRTSK
eukprot:gb/GFBE01051819.1/.p1 GENE.gb/GFBE01051819.1/~~gb/GFBE01051819.1/.p1  ORF type:complete len:144 (+),score=18.44 gb/GFBE01051819.1/:1-432(+)